MVREVAVAEERLRAREGGEVGNLVRHQPEIGRHPHRAQPEGGEHRPEHLVAILGMDENPVALADAARGQPGREGRDGRVDLGPCPGAVAPDEAGALRMALGIAGEEMRQVHHPARAGNNAAFRSGAFCGRHFARSRIET
jgi:hypothetical protein